MKITVQITVQSDEEQAEVVQEVASLERGSLRPGTLGLSLAEARAILAGLEQTMVERQAVEFVAQARRCPHCGRKRSSKDCQSIVFRTPFGKLTLASPRLYRCPCESPLGQSFSPLVERLPECTSPELVYLETKFAALISYGLSAELLADVLPTRGEINVAGVYRNVQRVAQRLEAELGEEKGQFIEGCQRDGDALPPPGSPITVGLDGGFVHAKGQKSRGEGWFEVIAGKSVPQEGAPKCFAYVQTYDAKPKRRLFEVLKSQGLQANQPVIFLSDGADDVRELPLYLSPESEHWLDWFHVAMRLTGMGQLAKGLANEQAEGPETAPAAPPEEASEEMLDLDAGQIGKQLERVKWFLWHGNVQEALETIEDINTGRTFASGLPRSRFTPVGHGALLLPPLSARRHLAPSPRPAAHQGAPRGRPPPPT